MLCNSNLLWRKSAVLEMFFLLISHRSLRFKKEAFQARQFCLQYLISLSLWQKDASSRTILLVSYVFCYAGAVLAASCSHGRSHEYFTESILTDCPFTAYPCDNYVRVQGLDMIIEKNCLVITQFLTCSLRLQTIHNPE